MDRRPRVLVYAYDADPTAGSESASGWGVTRSLAGFADCTVVVGPPTYEPLRLHAAENPDLRLDVVGVPDSVAQWVGRGLAEVHRQLEFISYLVWVRTARRMGQALTRAQPYDVAVHASYGVYWLASPVVDVGLPSVWGPTGGGVRTPPGLTRYLGWKGLLGEWERSLLLAAASRSPGTRRTWRRASVIMVENEETRDRLPPELRPRARLLNRAVFAPVPALEAAAEPEPYLLFPSALQGRKGPRLALAALRHAAPSVRITFVADGYERRTLVRHARKLGVADRVDFLGRVPRDEYFHRVTEAAAVMFTGLREEGGAALVEAMKLGAPVVVLDHGGAGWIARQATDPGRVWRVPAGGRDVARALGAAMSEAIERRARATTPLLDERTFDGWLQRAVREAAETAGAEGADGAEAEQERSA